METFDDFLAAIETEESNAEYIAAKEKYKAEHGEAMLIANAEAIRTKLYLRKYHEWLVAQLHLG